MRSLIEDRFSSLRFASLRIIQICLAAGVAWLIATRVVGHYEPFFAPISVVWCWAWRSNSGRRAYEIAFGVARHRDRRPDRAGARTGTGS